MQRLKNFCKFLKADRRYRLRLFLFLATVLLPLFIGCGDARRAMVIAGSTSVQPLMEKIVEEYRKEHPELKINVEGGGSSAGVMAVYTGTAKLGMSSRKLKIQDDKEKTLTPITIAYDAIIIVVHPDNPIASLTREQVRDLFAGRITSWQEVGGYDREVHMIVREEGSGTRSAFDELVMFDDRKAPVEIHPYALVQDSMGGVREVVRNDPDAIGFISMGGINDDVKVVRLNDVSPSFDNIRNHTYDLVRPFLLLAKGEPDIASKQLIDYVLSPAGEKLMLEEGCVSARK